MNTKTSLGKLYLIPVTMGESDPMDVLPQTVKRAIELIDCYIVENEKTARKSIKAVLPKKKQSELVLFALNKHTDAKGMSSDCFFSGSTAFIDLRAVCSFSTI